MDTDGSTHILLVDDKDDNLTALEAMLQGHGIRFTKARSGREALRCMLKQEYSLILLDVQMPDVDGFETAKLIQQREKIAQHTNHISNRNRICTNPGTDWLFIWRC